MPGTVIAWTGALINGVALVAAIWAALQTCFMRAGIVNEVSRTGVK